MRQALKEHQIHTPEYTISFDTQHLETYTTGFELSQRTNSVKGNARTYKVSSIDIIYFITQLYNICDFIVHTFLYK